MKKITLFIFLLLVLFTPNFTIADEAAYHVIDNQAKLPLLAPTFGERKVLKLRLANGLEAYIVSDPNTLQSGALLTVNVGSWNDPKEYPGIAHFLEHMLFLGTEKFPNESEYAAFVTEHDGVSNAFTAANNTSYLFSINNNAFEEALDRFSHFFKDPLFNPSGVSRELQAIDQEYAKNLENDDFRLFYIDKAFSNPEHPFKNFNMGNSSTLSNVSQDTLKKWYKDHYSANLMHLIVYSSLPIEKLKEIVVNDFSGVPNHNYKPFQTNLPIYQDTNEHEIVFVEPIKNSRNLSIVWELPASIVQMKDSLPTRIICYILGHEGQESLLAELKKEGFAERLACGAQDFSNTSSEFVLDIDLTDKGVKEVHTVIERCFQAIAYLKKNEIPRSLFDEVQRMATIDYQYQPRDDTFKLLMQQADRILQEDLATYPEHTSIVQKFDPGAIHTLLNLLTPQRAHFYLTAPSALTGISYDKKEQWMGVLYTTQKISPEFLAKWNQIPPNPDISIPAPNRLIPQQLSLVNQGLFGHTEDKLIPHPEIIQNDQSGLIYFAQDTRYLVPQIGWKIEIKTPQIEMGNALQAVLADLYVKSVKEALTAYSYIASQAGLNYSIETTNFGIEISIDGYSENADLLLDEIIKTLKQVKPTQEQFHVYKDSLEREYLNFSKKMPIQQAIESLRTAIYKKFTSEKQKAAAISRVTYDKFLEYASHIFDETFVEGIFYGNMSKKQAEAIVTKLNHALQSLPYPKGKLKRPEVIELPEKGGPFYWETSSKIQGNAAVLAVEYPGFDLKLRAMQQVLMQAMKQPFFNTLRTVQQTGYIVFSEGQEIERKLFNIFGVQSNSHAVRDLLARFELFIESYMQELPHVLPEDKFQLVKQSLLTTLEQPPKNVVEMANVLQTLAFDYQGDFDWISKRIQSLKDLTYPEFLALSENFMGRQNKRRLGILYKGVLPENEQFNYLPLKNLNELHRISNYSSLKPLSN